MITRLLRWLNVKLNIVEPNDDHNAYYAWADARLDELAATADQARKRKDREALERQLLDRGYRLVEPEKKAPVHFHDGAAKIPCSTAHGHGQSRGWD